MELIQNWNNEDKLKLKNFILNKIDVEYDDITIVGSRMFGDFTPTSDIDVVVWVNNHNFESNIFIDFNEVNNIENPDNKFRISIKFKDFNKFENDYWGQYNYKLPKYSIINNIYYSGNTNHVTHRNNFKTYIRDFIAGGGDRRNIPFNEFNTNNNHLLT